MCFFVFRDQGICIRKQLLELRLTVNGATAGADVTVTHAEARTMLRNALDVTEMEVFAQEDHATLTRGEAAKILYQAAKRSEEAGKKATF